MFSKTRPRHRIWLSGRGVAAAIVASAALAATPAWPANALGRPASYAPKHKPHGCLSGKVRCTFVTTNVSQGIGGGRFIVSKHAVRYGFGVYVGYTCDDGSTTTMLTGFSQTVPVSANGAFAYDDPSGAQVEVHVKGQIHGRSAWGTIDATISGQPSCHGSANWTAKAAG